MTLVATSLGLFMIKLDATIVNVALPDLQRRFDVGEQALQWVVAAYSLTMAMFMMSGATLADARGRRAAYVGGLVVFSVASLGCGLAPSIPVLALARGLQGVGAAVVSVTSLSLLVAAYPEPAAKAKAIGAWTGISAVGYALGPTVGGLLTGAFGWRSIFLVNPAVGVVAVVLCLAFVAESRDPRARRVDVSGQVLFAAGVGLLTYALVEAPHTGWRSPSMLAVFAVATVVLVAFVRTERRTSEPMMDLGLFSDRVYSVAIFTIFAVMFGVYGTLLVITQYLQNVQGRGPTATGLLMLSMTAPSIVAAPVSGRLTARLGARTPTLWGVASITVGMALLSLTAGGPIAITLVGLALTGVAGSLAVSPATTIGMSAVDPDRSAMGSGIISVQRALGSTAGFAVMGSILAAVVAATLPGALAAELPDRAERAEVVARVVDDANPRAVTSLIGPERPLPATIARVDALEDAAEGSFVTAMRVAWGAGAVVVAAALVAGWVTFPRRRAAA